MKNEIIESNDESLRENSDENSMTYYVSPEAVEKICQYGAAVMDKAIDAEMEIQINAMEQTVEGQSNVLKSHENKQKELLDNQLKFYEMCADQLNKCQDSEERQQIIHQMDEIRKQLGELYIANNKSLDTDLEKAKVQPDGIVKRLLSKILRRE